MRRVVSLILLLLCLPTIAQAQNLRFECATGERYDKQLTLLPPLITPDEAAQYIVSVIGLDEFQPIIAIEAPENPTFCNIASEQAAGEQDESGGQTRGYVSSGLDFVNVHRLAPAAARR